VRDLRSEEDLRYLLGALPPWISGPDWERGDAVQTLLALLWPALNTAVCALLRRELEERVAESSDFGHISFSRLSFGKHPPVVAGIKAVPLHGEDLLAMVLDVDIRWAGEPDVALRLTKLAGASLGLYSAQLSGVVRLVFAPITEDPPFLRRMAVSLLGRPYLDFGVRALGGLDLMALPAIDAWLHSVVMNLADRALVWPKEVGVPLVPPSAADDHGGEGGAAAAAAAPPPLGLLRVRLGEGRIEPRRSTFLGRLTTVTPRLSMVLPPPQPGRAGAGPAPAGGGGSVMQAAQTRAAARTLAPAWGGEEFVFVVTGRGQHLRLLLSHRRMELQIGDMPLGAAEIALDDVIADADAAVAAARAAAAALAVQQAQQAGGGGAPKAARALLQEEPSTPPAPLMAQAPSGDDGYASAGSSPASSSCTAAWATPSASLLRSEEVEAALAGPALSLSHAARAEGGAGAPAGAPAAPPHHGPGLGALLYPPSVAGAAAREPAADADHVLWAPHHGTPFDRAASPSGSPAAGPPQPAVEPPAAAAAAGGGWVAPEGVWVQLPATAAMTLAGMVAEAAEPRERAGEQAAVCTCSPPAAVRALRSWPRPRARPALLAAARAGTPFAAPAEEQRGWMATLQSMLLGAGHEEEEEEGEEEGGDGARPGATVARVHLTLEWLPVQSAVLQSAASLAQPSPKPQQRRGRGAARGRRSLDGEGEGEPPSRASSPGGGEGRPPGSSSARPGGEVARPPPLSLQSGVLAVRVAYTKTDYGQNPLNPVLAVSVAAAPAATASAVAAAAGAALLPQRRLVCLEAQVGGRPGLLHWGREFHLPVWDAAATRALLELGDASSSIKLSSYGPQLYALDAGDAFGADVAVEANAWIPLKDVLARGVVRGTWRLREARGGAGAGGVEAAAADRLDVGRAALMLSWFPLA
jgi:hypothetical protein